MKVVSFSMYKMHWYYLNSIYYIRKRVPYCEQQNQAHMVLNCAVWLVADPQPLKSSANAQFQGGGIGGGGSVVVVVAVRGSPPTRKQAQMLDFGVVGGG